MRERERERERKIEREEIEEVRGLCQLQSIHPNTISLVKEVYLRGIRHALVLV